MVVGVRVRPFNQREKDLNATLCVEMSNTATVLKDVSTGADRTFTFDESFWSFDNFGTDEAGYCYPTEGKSGSARRYADQRYVYETFGKRVLDNAWEGFHCCLFAYGQTGSGKSYSMVGYGANKGIVPISCEQIFARIASNTASDKHYEVTMSMVEIYNEAVQDLLILPEHRPKKGLDIHESKQLGIYIENVTKLPVESFQAISAAVDEAMEHRSTGSTAMNATSSRAHTVLTIEFKQVEIVLERELTKISTINLVDLAGSEKANQTGAQGGRLKEGIAINSSLTALGMVIEKLADKSQTKDKKKAASILIPYRNSKLTRLLQNALGGSSKTIMICAISPASSNYEETLSTLRYADRAKKIKNAAVVNENPQAKLLRELQEENEKLKQMMASGVTDQGATCEMVTAKQAEIEQMQAALKDMQRSFSDKLAEAKEKQQRRRMTLRDHMLSCYLANLNQDEALSGKIKHSLPEGKQIRVGCIKGTPGDDSDDSNEQEDEEEDDDEPPNVILKGEGVHPQHAVIQCKSGQCFLSSSGSAAESTFVNGACVKELPQLDQNGLLLEHGDCVCFGRQIFVFVNPSLGSVELLVLSGIATYKKATKELARKANRNALWSKTMRHSQDMSRAREHLAHLRKAPHDDELDRESSCSSVDSKIAELVSKEEELAAMSAKLLDQDTLIASKDAKILELVSKERELNILSAKLSDKDALIAAKDAEIHQLACKDQELAAMSAQLSNKDALIASKVARINELVSKEEELSAIINTELSNKNALIASKDAEFRELAALSAKKLSDKEALVASKDAEIAKLRRSLDEARRTQTSSPADAQSQQARPSFPPAGIQSEIAQPCPPAETIVNASSAGRKRDSCFCIGSAMPV